MSEFVAVAKVGDIETGKGQAFEIGDRVVAVFNDEGVYRAIDDMCPHMGASLATGFLESSEVACAWHGWRFDVRDGTWCDNRSLKTDVFEVRIDGDQILVSSEPVVQAKDQLDANRESETGRTPPTCDGCNADKTEDPESGSDA